MKKTNSKTEAIIFQAKNGAIELRGDLRHETLWATLDQISDVFGRDKSVISRHFTNIFADKELDRNSVVAKNATTAADGKTYQVEYYNLDAIISVGYRVNSNTATKFRQWATKTLRAYIIQGYALNKKQIARNYQNFLKSISTIQALLPEHVTLDPKAVLELVKEFSATWMSLDAYDKGRLSPIGTTREPISLTGVELTEAIVNLRQELLKKGEVNDIFAQERAKGNVEGIVGNVMQSFAGKSVYESAEEKAANLLYLMVKNHPFVDGNKRSGAFAFIWFLRRAKVRGSSNINPSALTVLTLLIAESDPKRKDQMIALVTTLLATKSI